jgi:hypothetical protein
VLLSEHRADEADQGTAEDLARCDRHLIGGRSRRERKRL